MPAIQKTVCYHRAVKKGIIWAIPIKAFISIDMPSRDTMISILSHMLNVIYYHRSRGKKSTVKVFWGSHLDNNSSLINFSGVFFYFWRRLLVRHQCLKSDPTNTKYFTMSLAQACNKSIDACWSYYIILAPSYSMAYSKIFSEEGTRKLAFRKFASKLFFQVGSKISSSLRKIKSWLKIVLRLF